MNWKLDINLYINVQRLFNVSPTALSTSPTSQFSYFRLWTSLPPSLSRHSLPLPHSLMNVSPSLTLSSLPLPPFTLSSRVAHGGRWLLAVAHGGRWLLAVAHGGRWGSGGRAQGHGFLRAGQRGRGGGGRSRGRWLLARGAKGWCTGAVALPRTGAVAFAAHRGCGFCRARGRRGLASDSRTAIDAALPNLPHEGTAWRTWKLFFLFLFLRIFWST